MKNALLLSYMGAPSTLKEIRPFLYRLFSDRELINFGVPPFLQKPLAYLISLFRTPKVKPQYEAIGGGSPLVKNVRDIGSLLEKETSLKVFVGMLYSEPLLERVSEKILKSGVERLFVLTLYPHYSRATVGATVKKVKEFLEGKLDLKISLSWADNPYYVDWVRFHLEPFLKKLNPSSTLVLFSAHSLPKYFVEKFNDPYVQEVEKTVKKVMGSFEDFEYFISYQSKVGPVEWLKPTTEEAIKFAKEKGKRNLVVFPVSFVCEHIETLYELDVEYKELAENLGLNFLRVPLNHKSSLLTRALEYEVEKLMKGD